MFYFLIFIYNFFMSKFDVNFDYLEEKYIYENINEDDDKIIYNIVNDNFNYKKLENEIAQENETYFQFLIEKVKESENCLNINNKEESFKKIKNQMFQECENLESQIKFMIDYLKYIYGVIDGKNLKQFFDEIIKDSLPLNEYEILILNNFNKNTINLKDNNEEKQLLELLLTILK